MPGLASYSSLDPETVEHLYIKTDHAHVQEVDPVTLEPIRMAQHIDFNPELKGPLAAAHYQVDPVTGDMYNFNLDSRGGAMYRIFRVSATTGKTDVIATVSGPNVLAAYVHSFFITEHFIVLCIFNAYLGWSGAKSLWTRNMLEALYEDPTKKNQWFIIDRIHGRGVVDVFESDPFFAFHTTNAWEEPSPQSENGSCDIILELSQYEDLDILRRFYYHNMKNTSVTALDYVGKHKLRSRPQLARWKLCNVNTAPMHPSAIPKPAELVFKAPKSDSVELPTINPLYNLKPSRYIYGCSDRGDSAFLDGLIKFDTLTQTAIAWKVHAHSPGEAIFVPDPEGEAEDHGVLLSVVLDGNLGTSYLLVLDARTFKEIGKAVLEIPVPFGFHGTHFKLGREVDGIPAAGT